MGKNYLANFVNKLHVIFKPFKVLYTTTLSHYYPFTLLPLYTTLLHTLDTQSNIQDITHSYTSSDAPSDTFSNTHFNTLSNKPSNPPFLTHPVFSLDLSKAAHVHGGGDDDDEILERAAFDADETDILKHSLVITTASFLELRMQEMQSKGCVMQEFVLPDKNPVTAEKNKVGGNNRDCRKGSVGDEGSGLGSGSGSGSGVEQEAQTNLNLSFNDDDDDDCEMVVPLSPLEAIIHMNNPPSPDPPTPTTPTTTTPPSTHTHNPTPTTTSSSSSSSSYKSQGVAGQNQSVVQEQHQRIGQGQGESVGQGEGVGESEGSDRHTGQNQGQGQGQGQGYPIVISLSGGVDSMVIAKILVALRKAQTQKDHAGNVQTVNALTVNAQSVNALTVNAASSSSSSSSSPSPRPSCDSHLNPSSTVHPPPPHPPQQQQQQQHHNNAAISTLLTLPIGPIIAVHIDYANREVTTHPILSYQHIL